MEEGVLHLYVNALTATRQSGSNSFGTVPFTGSGVEGADLSYFRKFLLKNCLFIKLRKIKEIYLIVLQFLIQI